MQNLKQEIIKILSFYDIFSFPLTSFEVYKNLGIKADFKEVYKELYDLKDRGVIWEESGYYYLPKGKGAAQRKGRFLISFKKIKRAKQVARILWRFPFIRFIGVCNSLGYLNAREDSDIDFFIITKGGRIWTARFLCGTFLTFLKLRPLPGNSKNKICLSFLIADDALDISHLALADGDPYFYYWLSWIVPLYDDGIYEKFIKENSWIKNYLPNFMEQSSSAIKPFPIFRHNKTKFTIFWGRRLKYIFVNIPRAHIISLKWMGAFFKRFLEIVLGDDSERALRFVQWKIMPRALKEAGARQDSSVVFNDKILKFHLNDRRGEYRATFLSKVKNIEI